MTNQQKFRITAGPSREELFDALRLRHEGRKVVMTVQNMVTTAAGPHPHNTLTMWLPLAISVTIDSIGIEEGGGNGWLLSLADWDNKLGSVHFRGYFNTTRREGWLLNAVTI